VEDKKMNKSTLIFFVSIISAIIINSSVFAGGALSIDNEDNIDRVANNVLSFWSVQNDLIPGVLNKTKLTKESIDQIKNNNTAVAQDFFRDKRNFLQDLDNTIEYVVLNDSKVTISIGQEKATLFLKGLFLLKRLIAYCIQ
jgi:hypothetical protein